MNLEGMRRQSPGGDGLPVTLCHHGEALLPRLARTAALATGWRACTVALSAVSKTPNRPGHATGRHRRGRPAEMRWGGQTELMRVVVTLIGPDGTMWRRMVDTAASSDSGTWEELLARALAALPPYRAVPGGSVYHLRVDDQVALVAEHDLSGPLYDLVTAVLAIGEAPH
jgi:hypothetical protein